MTVKIYGMQKTTLVDYPGRVATTLFTGNWPVTSAVLTATMVI